MASEKKPLFRKFRKCCSENKCLDSNICVVAIGDAVSESFINFQRIQSQILAGANEENTPFPSVSSV